MDFARSSWLNVSADSLEPDPIPNCPKCGKIPYFSLYSPTSISIHCDYCSENQIIEMSTFLSQLKETPMFHNCFNTKKHSEGVPANQFCIQCKKWLCVSCLQDHNQYNKEHQTSDSEVNLDCKCENHPVDRVVSFCLNCRKHLCHTCRELHKDHKTTQLDTLLNTNQLLKINENYSKAKEKVKSYYKQIRDEAVNALNAKIIEIERAYDQNSQINDNIMSYIHMLINSYTVTQKTPTFPIITNYIKNTKFNLKQKEDILKNKSETENFETKIGFAINYLQNDFILPSKYNLSYSLKHHDNTINHIIVMKSGDIVSCSTDNTIKVFNDKYELKQMLTEHNDKVTYICEIENERIVSCSLDKRILIWKKDNEQYTIEKELKGHSEGVNKVISLGFNKIASCSKDKTIKIWNTKDSYECIATLQEHKENVVSILQLADKRLVSISTDRTLLFWNLETFEPDNKLTKKNVTCLTSNGMIEVDGKLVITGDKLYVLDIVSLKCEIISNSILKNIQSICEIDKGIVVFGNEKGNLIECDIETKQCKVRIECAHSNSITTIAKQGDILMTGSDDCFINIWTLL